MDGLWAWAGNNNWRSKAGNLLHAANDNCRLPRRGFPGRRTQLQKTNRSDSYTQRLWPALRSWRSGVPRKGTVRMQKYRTTTNASGSDPCRSSATQDADTSLSSRENTAGAAADPIVAACSEAPAVGAGAVAPGPLPPISGRGRNLVALILKNRTFVPLY